MLTFQSEKTDDNKVEYEDKMITQQVDKRIRKNPKTVEDSFINTKCFSFERISKKPILFLYPYFVMAF